jgi:NACalpha-BTF3-like transcription factor
MALFYEGLSTYYKGFGLDIESNRGRRNILMSEPMEIFLADELRKTHGNVISDGQTGKADIMISFGDGKNIELECKLTSPHTSSGSICFQTDFETLEKKKKLDYIYIVANEDFTGFCAVYFEGLTTSDFRAVSSGSRGKVQMYKYLGMKKAKVLMGEVVNLNDDRIKRLKISGSSREAKINNSLSSWKKIKSELRSTQIYDCNVIDDKIERAKEKLSIRLNKTKEDIKLVKERKPRYTFKYEKLEE